MEWNATTKEVDMGPITVKGNFEINKNAAIHLENKQQLFHRIISIV